MSQSCIGTGLGCYQRSCAFCVCQVRLPLRELLFKSCTERSDACLHYTPRGQISNYKHSEIYDAIKSAW